MSTFAGLNALHLTLHTDYAHCKRATQYSYNLWLQQKSLTGFAPGSPGGGYRLPAHARFHRQLQGACRPIESIQSKLCL